MRLPQFDTPACGARSQVLRVTLSSLQGAGHWALQLLTVREHGRRAAGASHTHAPSVSRNTRGSRISSGCAGVLLSMRSACMSGVLMSVVPRALTSSFTHSMHVRMFSGVAYTRQSAAQADG